MGRRRKRGPGRPTLEGVRLIPTTSNLSERDRETIEELAREDGLTMSEWIRRTIKERLRRGHTT